MKEIKVCLQNFNQLYAAYQADLNNAVWKWQRNLHIDRDEAWSLVNEIFLGCVKAWDNNKKNKCKFRSFLFTQLNRRMNNVFSFNGRAKRVPKDKMINFNDLVRMRLATLLQTAHYYEADDDFDNNVEFDAKGPDKSPLDILIVKDQIDQLKNKSEVYEQIINSLDEFLNSDIPEGLTNDNIPRLFDQISDKLNIPVPKLRRIMGNMKDDLNKIVRE